VVVIRVHHTPRHPPGGYTFQSHTRRGGPSLPVTGASQSRRSVAVVAPRAGPSSVGVAA
jgi:hypothetical protein